MDKKQKFQQYRAKFKENWEQGKWQRKARITYDVVWNVVLFFLIIGFIGLFFAGGAGAGYFASLVKDMPVRSYESMENSVYSYEETSELYFTDNQFMGTIRSDLYREEVKLGEVSEHVTNALIATEDVYFKSHDGVVPKAILRAVYQEATNAAVKTGGSTLTQQLIKNQILTNEVSFERKAKEILLALRLEQTLDKDEILEAYLNIVPFGRNAAGENIAGIQTAAQGIFGVDASELNLPQSAFLAGLPQSPSYYTPFKNGGGVKDETGLEPGLNRMKTVLDRMLEAEFITQQEYEKAINYDITADFTDPVPSALEKYPYLTNEVEEKAIKILSKELAIEDGYTEEDFERSTALQEEYRAVASRELRSNGYKIHTTINKEIYEEFQEIAAGYENFGPDKPEVITDPETGKEKTIMEPVQAAGMLIENSTGRIISFLGGRGYEYSQVNHATDSLRNNGSTMKPILVYAPAIEEDIIQPGSVVLDAHINEKYPELPEDWPSNYTGDFHGLVSIREALKKSYNVPAAKTYMQIIESNPAKNYLEKMGFTSLQKFDYTNPSMAIGSMEAGVTLEENTNAYTTFGNNGEFVDAYMIEKIETKDGEVLFEHEAEAVEVFSPETSYLTIDMMRDVLTSGTAVYAEARLDHPDVDWAGKTGTAVDWWDTWFVATNPNVTMGTWLGYDTPKSLKCNAQYPCDLSYSNRNIGLWSELVNAATEIAPELMAPEKDFERPEDIEEGSYCATSGLAPSELCEDAGLVREDIYHEENLPEEEDDSLMRGDFIRVNGKAVVAGANTPEEFTSGNGISFNPNWLKRNMYDELDDLSDLYPSRSNGWGNVALPSSLSTGAVENDNSKPDAPDRVTVNGGTLSWSASDSDDVIGYRVYRSSRPDSDFSQVSDTTDTDYEVPGNGAFYMVKAVDYFGRESTASNVVQAGEKPQQATSNTSNEAEQETESETVPPAETNNEET